MLNNNKTMKKTSCHDSV